MTQNKRSVPCIIIPKRKPRRDFLSEYFARNQNSLSEVPAQEELEDSIEDCCTTPIGQAPKCPIVKVPKPLRFRRI